MVTCPFCLHDVVTGEKLLLQELFPVLEYKSVAGRNMRVTVRMVKHLPAPKPLHVEVAQQCQPDTSHVFCFDHQLFQLLKGLSQNIISPVTTTYRQNGPMSILSARRRHSGNAASSGTFSGPTTDFSRGKQDQGYSQDGQTPPSSPRTAAAVIVCPAPGEHCRGATVPT
ncbi:hypothetical protein AVEN_264681-1 [Araneus ventricosus]|uniref:Uncharacterized protein n=1 Tax=Araneus ventricosus TaxID=182803 RepID=A0A4Y2K723_ARAVE|nr:hypothetical protein AVEN_264681-1 [Araneus ventricosus]